MIVFVVSPNYLRHIEEESAGYEFMLQGYESFKDAITGLTKTNASEIYGFAVVMDELPQTPKDAIRFLELCNMICSVKKKRFVFCLKSGGGVEEILRHAKNDFLEVFLATFEVMTDSTIKRDIFGTILSRYLQAYGEGEGISVPPLSKLRPVRSLSYSPIFSSLDLKALEFLSLKDTEETTVIEDPYLEDLRGESDFHYALRKFGIRKAFNPELTSDEGLEGYFRNNEQTDLLLHQRVLYDLVRSEGINEETSRPIVRVSG